MVQRGWREGVLELCKGVGVSVSLSHFFSYQTLMAHLS